MVTLDVAGSALAVDLLEVESACLTCEGAAPSENGFDLLLTQPLVSLPCSVPTQEQPSFGGAEVVVKLLVVGLDEILKLASADALPDEVCNLGHLVGTGKELIQDFNIKGTALRWLTVVVGVPGSDVERLAGHAIGVAKRFVAIRVCVDG